MYIRVRSSDSVLTGTQALEFSTMSEDTLDTFSFKVGIRLSKCVKTSLLVCYIGIIEMCFWNGFALPHWLLKDFFKYFTFQACTTHTLIQRMQSLLYIGHTNMTKASTCLPEKPPGTYQSEQGIYIKGSKQNREQ